MTIFKSYPINGMEQGDEGQVERELREVPKAGKGFAAVIPNPKLKLLDQVREVLRLRHYSIRTEQSYCDWIRRFIKFHRMRSREELIPGEGKIEMFLSDLAINGKVAASLKTRRLMRAAFPLPRGAAPAVREYPGGTGKPAGPCARCANPRGSQTSNRRDVWPAAACGEAALWQRTAAAGGAAPAGAGPRLR